MLLSHFRVTSSCCCSPFLLPRLAGVDLLRASGARSRQIHPHIIPACCWHSLVCLIKFRLLNLTSYGPVKVAIKVLLNEVLKFYYTKRF